VTTFYSHFEKALRKSATSATAGRLQGSTDVILADVANPAVTSIAKAPYELFGPGDVQRLAADAITRRFPAPNASDAEVTKLALVEFAAPDLPWRYTPRLAGPGELRPWIVLVVGQRAPGDIVLRPDGRVTLGLIAQNHHVLSLSAQWAHVQHVDGHDPIARVVAPPATAPGAGAGHLDYAENTEYVACVVPAFTATGADSWNGTAQATCDLYDWWTFRTGPQGDFHELAAKLHKADLDANQKPGGKPFGRAEVSYRHRAGPVKTTTLATAGALRLPPSGAAPDPADASPSADIAAEVTALTLRIVTSDGRGVITAPRYDAAFSNANAAVNPAAGGWIDQMRRDPRLRGAAGLGAWIAIEWQDRIADAAAAKAGDLAIARDRISHVAFGVEASRSLWRRRLPADPADRLAVLGPALGRLVTTTGASVLDAIAGRTPGLTRALLSSAARRALRPGPARTALTAAGVAPFGAVLVAANACAERPDAAVIRRTRNDPGRAIKKAVIDAARGDAVLATTILRALGNSPSVGKVAAALRALAPGDKGVPDRDVVERFLRANEFPDADRSILEWPGWMNEHGRREHCKPIDLAGLAAVVAAAIDPTVPRPPAAKRVLSTLPGITHIGPVEIEPELDLPLWSFFSDRAPDWMLPGAGDLVDGDVVGLSTNPVFVESLLIGANYQATAELRWRNVPLVTRWSPLRKFWQRRANDVDILPIKAWPDVVPLGNVSLVPAGRTAEAVVAFRTPLFRRYPATVVYLYPAQPNFVPPDPKKDDLNVDRVMPTFTGTIGSDITFFGFALPPEALATHWVVLEEPPAGYRFYHKAVSPPPPAPPAGIASDSSSDFAYRRFAVPVRVLIGPLL
jgi:hypothetical protein